MKLKADATGAQASAIASSKWLMVERSPLNASMATGATQKRSPPCNRSKSRSIDVEEKSKGGRPKLAPSEQGQRKNVYFQRDVLDWLNAQPGGISKTIAELVRSKMVKKK